MGNPLDDILYYDEWQDIIKADDKEQFLPHLSAYGDTVTSMMAFNFCANFHAKKCLLAMVQGEVCAPAHQIYARLAPDHNPNIPTPLACVASLFPQADDIVDLLLKQGPVDHANICCRVKYSTMGDRTACPLDYVLVSLSDEPHLLPWSSGASLIKLIILLCQWESNPHFKSARLLAPHTNRINDIAWLYVKEGRLVPFAALLLLAQEKVFLSFDSGSTIRQRIMDMLQKLSFERDLDHGEALYQSMLIDACKLFDIFERAGGALTLYCNSMHEYVPPHKVLIDVASLLKKAGYALEPRDHDLRDCYRDCPEITKATMYKLSDNPGSQDSKYRLPSSLSRAQGSGTTISSYPHPGYCQLLQKLKSGSVVNLNPSAYQPRLFRTAAGQVENGGSGITRKHLASFALRLKRGVKL